MLKNLRNKDNTLSTNEKRPTNPNPETAPMANSPARRDANRKNAMKSTGPRTTDGKRRSSTDAPEHGLRIGAISLTDEDQAKQFDALVACLDLRDETDRLRWFWACFVDHGLTKPRREGNVGGQGKPGLPRIERRHRHRFRLNVPSGQPSRAEQVAPLRDGDPGATTYPGTTPVELASFGAVAGDGHRAGPLGGPRRSWRAPRRTRSKPSLSRPPVLSFSGGGVTITDGHDSLFGDPGEAEPLVNGHGGPLDMEAAEQVAPQWRGTPCPLAGGRLREPGKLGATPDSPESTGMLASFGNPYPAAVRGGCRRCPLLIASSKTADPTSRVTGESPRWCRSRLRRVRDPFPVGWNLRSKVSGIEIDRLEVPDDLDAPGRGTLRWVIRRSGNLAARPRPGYDRSDVAISGSG